MNWYHSWHNHPRHQHAHWLFFSAVLISVFSFVSGEIGEFNLETDSYGLKINIAHAAEKTITVSGDKFALDGSAQFLLFASYFNGLAASQATLNSDFSALRSRGFNGVRVLVNWPCTNCPADVAPANQYRLHNFSDGSYRSGMLSRLNNLITTAQTYDLIVDLTFMDASNFSSFTAYRTALENTARDTIAHRNVTFDLQNEADHGVTGGGGWTGSVQLPINFANQLANAITAIDPDRLITVSSDASFDPAYLANSNFDFAAPHIPPRSGNWPASTRTAVNTARGQLPRVMPIYLQEPERYRGTAPYSDTADDWFTSAKNAKCAGAAAWTFHNAASYDLSGGSMFSQFNSVENQIASGLNGELNSIGWFSCATGVSPTPTPTPTIPPSPPLPAANHQIQFTYYFIDGTFGDYRSEVRSTVGPYIIIAHNWGPRLTEIDAEFQRAVSDGKRIIFAPNHPWTDPTPGLLEQHLDVAKNYWNSIDWIYFDEPSYTKAQMESFITNFEALVSQRGLASKPIGINFTDTQFATRTGYQATNIDYVGLEAYMDPSLQNDPNLVSSLNTKIDQIKAQIGSRTIFIVIQAYNRNGTWTNLESLKSIQTPAYLKAYNDTRVNALLLFSYGRSGGTRDLHQCIRTEHLRMWGAITGTSQPNSISCSGIAPTPPPPPGGAATAYIYYVDPFSVPAGETIVITGQTLSTTVNFYSASRTLTAATGTLSRDQSQITVIVPVTLAPGKYTLSSAGSNEVRLEILPVVSEPMAAAANAAEPCPPDSIIPDTLTICDFAPDIARPGDSVSFTGSSLAGAMINLTDSSTNQSTVVTPAITGDIGSFTVPNVAEGSYTVGLFSNTGSAISTKNLTVSLNPPPPPGGPPPGNPPFNPPGNKPLPPAAPFQNIITNAFNYSLVVVGIAVFIMIMWGGFLWLTSAANPANLGVAKKYITNALLGALLLVSAYVILRTINPELVGGGFTLPGIEAPQ